jgi:hypothetical protein
MMDKKKDLRIGRRTFVKVLGTAAVALPFMGFFKNARAAEKVSPNDPMAQSLKYVEDASKADPSVRGGNDRFCHNCMQYTGDPNAEYGPCNIFGGKLVSSKGWCMSWVKKP